MNLRLEGGGDSFAKYMPNPLVSKRSLNRVPRCCFSRLLFDEGKRGEGKRLFSAKKVLLVSSKESFFFNLVNMLRSE